MKKTVTLQEKITKEIQVEVELPIYRKHDVGGDGYESVIYSRVDEEREVSIHKTYRYGSSAVEWQLEIDPSHRINGDIDYALGRGEFASHQLEYETALAELKTAVDEEVQRQITPAS